MDEELLEELEEILITSDIGMDTTMKIIERAAEPRSKMRISQSPEDVKRMLKKIIAETYRQERQAETEQTRPLVITDDRHKRRRQDDHHRQART